MILAKSTLLPDHIAIPLQDFNTQADVKVCIYCDASYNDCKHTAEKLLNSNTFVNKLV